MPNILHKLKQEDGLIGFITLFSISVIILAVTSSLVIIVNRELKTSRNGGALDETFYSAESGLNEALYRLASYPGPKQYNFTLNGTIVEASVKANPADPYQRIIEAKATSAEGKIRTVEIIANTSSYAGGFDYAVQGGTGGIVLENNSTIIGDVYSNGTIWGSNGAVASGSVWVALDNKLDNVNVTKDVHAKRIERSNIDGQAYYTTIDNASKVGGSNCLINANCHPASPEPSNREFPLKQSDLQRWKDEISSSSIPVSSTTPATCPQEYNSGYYCITEDTTLGNQKIDASLYIDDKVVLTLNGNLWVTGEISLKNNGLINIDSVLDAGSVVLIAGGPINVRQNFSITGSGDPSSFILMITENPSLDSDHPAINAENNSQSIIFAALHGLLKVNNVGSLNAAVAEKLYLMQNSSVTFNPQIAAFYVPNGGENNLDTIVGSWQEK